jgi:hypothetical protein
MADCGQQHSLGEIPHNFQQWFKVIARRLPPG